MDWLDEFAGCVEREAPLDKLTSYRLGGRARAVFHPQGMDALAGMLRRGGERGIPVKVLGGGANVLVRDDGFDGVVVRLDQPAFRDVKLSRNRVRVGAGANLMPLSRELSAGGLSGLEAMAGIPGTVGGAVRMNAGGRHREIGDVVSQITVMDSTGRVEAWSHDRIGFAYRHTALGDRIVLSIDLELRGDDPKRVRKRYREHLAAKTASQPLTEASAGCVFKNPANASAGALIDQAGLKGASCGGACVSHKHANFIVARRGATAGDVLRLIDRIREKVRELYDTELETEIEIW
jgi:UDP-N-acetylmuramate dehydrogenase